MQAAERLETISIFAEGIAEQHGFSIVEVKFGQEGKKRTLEVSIFRVDQPVSLSDCEQFSRALESRLDEKSSTGAPIIDGSYSLVVQSPGIDRVLKSEREFRVFAGQTVQVQTKEKVLDLGVKFTGVLIGVGPEEVKLAHAKPVSSRAAKKGAEPEVESE